MSENTTRGAGGSGGAREKIKEKAAGLAGGAKDAVRGQYHRGLSSVVGELNSLASALRQAGDQMRDGEKSTIALTITTRIAERVETLGESLDGRDLEDVIDSVETFARRNPTVFLGTAAAVGFLAARFIKSSATAAQQAMAARTTEQYASAARAAEFRASSASTYSGSIGTTPGTTQGTTPGTAGSTSYGSGSGTTYGTGAPASEFGSGSTGSGIGAGTTGSNSGRRNQ